MNNNNNNNKRIYKIKILRKKKIHNFLWQETTYNARITIIHIIFVNY